MKPHSNKQIHLEVMEPVLRSFWELEVLDPPSQALLDSDWLTYKLPEWIQDHCVSHCGICSNKFNVFRRKHHCRACGGIYCHNCACLATPIPQFGVSTPQRVCQECLKKQCQIFDLQKQLLKLRSKIESIEEQKDLLREQYANILLVGSNFIRYDKDGPSDRRLIFEEDLKTFSEINLKTDTLSDTLYIEDIDIKLGVDRQTSDALNLNMHSQCFTVRTVNDVYVYQATNNEHSLWCEGIALAKKVSSIPNDVEKLQTKISKIVQDMDALIRSQMNYAVAMIVDDISKSHKKKQKPKIISNDHMFLSDGTQESQRNMSGSQRQIFGKHVFFSKKESNDKIDEIEDILN